MRVAQPTQASRNSLARYPYRRAGIVAVLTGLGLLGLIAWGLQRSRPRELDAASSVTRVRWDLPEARGGRLRAEDFEQAGLRLPVVPRAVIMHFWATWCAPCLAEIPEFLDAARWAERERLALAWVAVSLDDSFEEAESVLPRARLTPTVFSLLDLKRALPEQMGTYQYPETYVLDAQGRVLTKWVGPQPWASVEMRSWLRAAAQATPRSD